MLSRILRLKGPRQDYLVPETCYDVNESGEKQNAHFEAEGLSDENVLLKRDNESPKLHDNNIIIPKPTRSTLSDFDTRTSEDIEEAKRFNDATQVRIEELSSLFPVSNRAWQPADLPPNTITAVRTHDTQKRTKRSKVTRENGNSTKVARFKH